MKANELLIKLRQHAENRTVDKNGIEWGDVYLPNVGRGHSFAGLLSTLRQQGLYKPLDSEFGTVRLTSEVM